MVLGLDWRLAIRFWSGNYILFHFGIHVFAAYICVSLQAFCRVYLPNYKLEYCSVFVCYQIVKQMEYGKI